MTEGKYPQKILIVEDEQAMLHALLDNLRAAGFENLLVAKNGEEGLALAITEKPNLILLDIVLPKMDGMSMLKKLRENEEGKKIKVILLTNLTADDSIMTGIVSNEPSYYLIKTEHSVGEVVEKVKIDLGLSS